MKVEMWWFAVYRRMSSVRIDGDVGTWGGMV